MYIYSPKCGNVIISQVPLDLYIRTYVRTCSMSAQKRETEADLAMTVSKVVVVVSGGRVDTVLERT